MHDKNDYLTQSKKCSLQMNNVHIQSALIECSEWINIGWQEKQTTEKSRKKSISGYVRYGIDVKDTQKPSMWT